MPWEEAGKMARDEPVGIAADQARETSSSERVLVEACPDVVVLLRIDGTVLEANDAALRMLGVDRAGFVGHCAFDFFPAHVAEGRRAMTREVARTKRPLHQVDFNDPYVIDNLLVPLFDADGEVDRLAIYARDITARFRAEREARERERRQHESEKLSALRGLASDVAHEANNLLTPIVNYLRLAKNASRVEAGGERAGLLDTALSSAERAAALIQRVVETPDEHAPPSTTAAPAPPAPAPQRRAEAMRVLAVDDEAGVLQVVEVALMMAGHDVRCFQTAEEGLAAFERAPESFDAAILDQNLADGTGVELARRFRDMAPDVHIVLASGRPTSELRGAVEALKLRLLAKPFSVESLQGALDRG